MQPERDADPQPVLARARQGLVPACVSLGEQCPVVGDLLQQSSSLGDEQFQRDLVARLVVDVAADESVRSVADAASVVRERTATVISVGMSKLGGPTAALQAALA